MDFIRSIKEGLKDPKKRSITMFVLYFIFFIFVYIVLHSADSKSNIIVDDELDEVESYEYIYKIIDNNTVTNIEGTYNKNRELFNIDGINYYKEDDIIYLGSDKSNIVENTFPFLNYYKYSSIQKLIDLSTFINEVTYNDDSKKSNYEITIDKYLDFIDNKYSCDEINCNIISTITVEEDKYIKHVLIDLQNYYGYVYNIDITYNNINNIKELK